MELNYLTISEAISLLSKKTLTSFELTNHYLKKIEALEPKLNSFVSVCADAARKQAKEADKLLESDPKIFESKPLWGVPIAIKDNFSTKGVQTTASSNIIRGYIPQFDATVVAKLKEAGALVLGKTNLDAFAHGSSTETSDFGSSKNPWDISRLPGGSSGGSASSVAADEAIASIGSETAGSIRQPAAWCGVVGLKPTYGRVSRFGVVAMASSTDSPGPISRNVEDANTIYKIISGYDPLDATSAKKELRQYSKSLNLQNLKIGLPKEYFRSESQKGINDTVMTAAKVLEEMGAKLVEISLFDPKYAISVYTIIQRSEVSSNLARFDGIRFGNSRDKFNDENKRRIMLGTYTLSSGYYDAYYKKAQQVRTLIIQDFEKAFGQVDLVLGPTSPTVAQKVGITQGQDMYGELADILVEPSSIAGLPGLNMPCGFVENMPVGMQLIGPAWSEDLLLSVGHRFEEQTEWNKMRPNIN